MPGPGVVEEYSPGAGLGGGGAVSALFRKTGVSAGCLQRSDASSSRLHPNAAVPCGAFSFCVGLAAGGARWWKVLLQDKPVLLRVVLSLIC